ncbi:MAG: hypothetical protein NTU89_00715 [Candidatus Dependentiae bacterium]|nr:hypothetical protein [Candidatus Dependentiae bacterium]
MKSINYLFLFSFLVGPASFVSAMHESEARNQSVAKPKPEDLDAMKARHIQELENLETERSGKSSELDKKERDCQVQLNKARDYVTRSQNQHAATDDDNDSSGGILEHAKHLLEDHVATHVNLEQERNNSDNEHLTKIENLKAQHEKEINAGSFLPEVKKGWIQRFLDSFFSSDVADAKNLFNSGNGVKRLKTGGREQNPSDYVFDKSKLKEALGKLSAEQRVDVVNDYLKNSLKGNNNTEVAGQNTKALVEILNSMLPKNEKVSVGSNGISIMKSEA